jgi:hypothetical protein
MLFKDFICCRSNSKILKWHLLNQLQMDEQSIQFPLSIVPSFPPHLFNIKLFGYKYIAHIGPR